MQVRISRWGNSLAVRLPKKLAEQLRLSEGQTVDLTIVEDALKLAPEATTRIPRYRLEDLLGQCDPEDAPEPVDWGPDLGAEVIEDDYLQGPRRDGR